MRNAITEEPIIRWESFGNDKAFRVENGIYTANADNYGFSPRQLPGNIGYFKEQVIFKIKKYRALKLINSGANVNVPQGFENALSPTLEESSNDNMIEAAFVFAVVDRDYLNLSGTPEEEEMNLQQLKEKFTEHLEQLIAEKNGEEGSSSSFSYPDEHYIPDTPGVTEPYDDGYEDPDYHDYSGEYPDGPPVG